MKETFFMTMRFIVFEGVFARLEMCGCFHLWVCVCVYLCLWEGRRKVRVRECSMQGPTEAKVKRWDCLKAVKLQTACCRSTPSCWRHPFIGPVICMPSRAAAGWTLDWAGLSGVNGVDSI